MVVLATMTLVSGTLIGGALVSGTLAGHAFDWRYFWLHVLGLCWYWSIIVLTKFSLFFTSMARI